MMKTKTIFMTKIWIPYLIEERKMRIERTVYFIITKKRPIEFHAGDGEMTDEFADAEVYKFLDEAQNELNEFDEPNKFVIIQGTLGCEV